MTQKAQMSGTARRPGHRKNLLRELINGNESAVDHVRELRDLKAKRGWHLKGCELYEGEKHLGTLDEDLAKIVAEVWK